MAQRTRAETDLSELSPVQEEGTAVFQARTEQTPVPSGSPASEGEVHQLEGVAPDDMAVEEELYTHPFWALLLRAGYTLW